MEAYLSLLASDEEEDLTQEMVIVESEFNNDHLQKYETKKRDKSSQQSWNR